MACLSIGLIELALIFILNKDSHTSFLNVRSLNGCTESTAIESDL